MMRTGCLRIDDGTLETGWWGPDPAAAPTLVLLHEGLGSVALWRDVPDRLAAATGWGVFAYSRFGYGQSGGTALPRPMSYMHDEALTVLPKVLAAAGIRQAVLAGHSDGGSIAAIYAGSFQGHASRRFPDAGSWPGDHTNPGNLLGLITIAAHFIVEDLNIDSIRRIKQEYDTGTLRPRLARYHRDVDTAFRGWNDAWLNPSFRDFDITGFLPHIRVPVLALQGSDDPYGSDEQLRIFRTNARVPITTCLIPGARHSPHLEAGEATLTAIATFIATLPRGAST